MLLAGGGAGGRDPRHASSPNPGRAWGPSRRPLPAAAARGLLPSAGKGPSVFGRGSWQSLTLGAVSGCGFSEFQVAGEPGVCAPVVCGRSGRSSPVVC